MADVIMDFNGVRKRVPAERAVYFQEKKGGKIVQDTPAAAPAPAPPENEAPGLWERAREGVKGAGRAAIDGLKGLSETQQDMGQSFLKGASLGLDDEIAALTARAGGLVQRQRDSDDLVGMGGGESVLESWRATAPLGEEARAERRAETERASQRSPVAAGVGTLAGAITTGMAAPGAQGGRLAQVASGGGVGAIGGAGMGDGKTAEDVAADALLGGGLGAAAAGVVPAVTAAKQALGGLAKRAPTVSAPSAPLRARAADLLSDVAERGTVDTMRKRAVGALADKVRGAPPPAAPTRSAYEQALDEAMARMDDPAVLRRANEAIAQPAKVLDEPMLLVTPKAKAPTSSPVPEIDAGDFGPDQLRGAVAEIGERVKPVPAPPAPARGPAGEVLTDLRRGTLGRRATQTEIRNAIEAVAIREGTTDIATLSNKIGVPTTGLRDVLTPMLRDFQFREAVKAGGVRTGPVSSALDEADQMGRTIRDAQQGARSPIDNVSGRKANQVFAVQQQERWRSAYDALPPEQRAAYIEQLRKTSGLSDDVLRRRLKMTMAEWRRTSFERSKAAAPMIKPRAEEPSPTGGEGESEFLTDMEMESLVERARDTLRLHAPWAVDKAGALPMESLERLAQIGAGNLPKTAVPGGLSPRAWTEVTLKKSGIQNAAEAVAPMPAPAPKSAPVIRPKKGKTFFHTTSAGDMEDIASMGLQPMARPSKFGGGYEGNSQGRLFLAGTDDAAKNWASKVEDALFHDSDDVIRQTPVSLRVKVSGKVSPDTVGSRDVPDSFFTEEGIGPESIEFFDGESWKPLSQWAYIEGRAYVPKTFAETKKVLRKKSAP